MLYWHMNRPVWNCCCSTLVRLAEVRYGTLTICWLVQRWRDGYAAGWLAGSWLWRGVTGLHWWPRAG